MDRQILQMVIVTGGAIGGAVWAQESERIGKLRHSVTHLAPPLLKLHPVLINCPIRRGVG